jgi:hypothetical protein
MANATWKKLEKSDAFRKVKLFIKKLTGNEPRFNLDVHLDTRTYCNWEIYPEIIQKGDIVYSLGVCDSIGFDLAAIQEKNVELHAFDPTPYTVDCKARNSEKFPLPSMGYRT